MPVIRKLYHTGNSNILVVPEDIRKHLGVNKGDYLVWAVDNRGYVIVEKLTPQKHPGYFIPGTGFVKHGH